MSAWVILCGLTVSTAVPASDDGLVAEFAFEEGEGRRLVDTSGSGQRARATDVEWVTGHTGRGLRFGEPASAVRVSCHRNLNLDQAITLEAWVLPGPDSDLSRIIVAKNDEYLLRIDKAPEGGRVSFFVHVGSPAVTWEPRVSSREPLTPGVWHHLAGTWDGRNLRLYVDRELQGETERTGWPNPNPYPVMIGSFEYPSCHGGAFGGVIDEVRIYRRALNADEVRKRAQEGDGPPGGSRGLRCGLVRVADHSLTDDGGPFLGLGVSYFPALWRCRHDRARLQSDLAFLARQGFNYYRALSMVGWYPAWAGQEIAPVSFTSRDGRRVEAWPDYWEQLRQLVDLAHDRYGLRAQITIFADAQLMPAKADRLEHLRRLLAEVVAGRESKIILLEVANEGWQNGFEGQKGVSDLREFAQYLAERTEVPVAITSNHEGSFADLYSESAADIATWHFSRDRTVDDGWLPVHDCWRLGDLPGLPPVSSNEPVGPGSSVASETEPIRLVMAAAFAWAAKLPMYVFHSEAGVFGRTRFEDTPAVTVFRHLPELLPGDLASWERSDGKGEAAVFTTLSGGQTDGNLGTAAVAPDSCVRMAQSRKGLDFVCVPIGIRPRGLELKARTGVHFRLYHPLTGKSAGEWSLGEGERCRLPAGTGGWLLVGRVRG